MTKKKTAETSTEMTVSERASAIAGNNPGFDMSKFKVKEVITIPLLKPVLDRPFGVQIVSDFYEGREIDDSRFKQFGRPTMIRVVDLSDGVEKEMMVQSVLMSTLTDYCGEGEASYAQIANSRFSTFDEAREHPYALQRALMHTYAGESDNFNSARNNGHVPAKWLATPRRYS